MTGWRPGYAVAPPEIIREMSKAPQHSVSQATTFAMWGGVAATPGSAFYSPGWIRLSYATSMDRLKEAMGRIRRVGGK